MGLLAEPERLRVVAAVALGASGFAEVVARSGLSAPVVGKALRRLESAGLVTTADGALVLHEELFKAAARSDRPEPEDLGVVDPADEATLRAFIRNGRLTHLPVARAKVEVVLRYIVTTFEPGLRYPERDVNAMLSALHADYAQLRRTLVDHGLLTREAGVYWRTGGWVDTASDG